MVWINGATNQGFIMNTPIDRLCSKQETWIGLAHVKPRPGNKTLGNAIGAIAPVLALAFSTESFVSKAVKMLNICKFDVVEIEDIEPLQKRLKKCDVSSDIIALATSLNENCSVAFGSFHLYSEE
jgi:hypothetical protein